MGLQRLYEERDTRERRPITRDILRQLISRFDQSTLEGANIQAAFCLAFAGFLRIEEFTYDKVKCDFNSWNLIQGSICLSIDLFFLVLSALKTDLFCQGITPTISATTDEAYAIKSLCSLFERFPQPYHHPMFSNSAGTLGRNYVTEKLQERICVLGYEENYSGHSFWRGAATLTRLAGLSEDEIQLLGR